MFLHCSSKPIEDHYHGPQAKGKYLYIGRYQRDEECGLDAIDESYKSFTGETKWTMAEWFRRNYKNGEMIIESPSSGTRSILSNTGMVIVNERLISREELVIKAERIHEEEWNSLTEEKKEIYVWMEMLILADYHIKVIPVEFVDYDEGVYQALVYIEADNGQIAENEDQLGRV